MTSFILYILLTVIGLLLMKSSGLPIEFGSKEGILFLNISFKMVLALIFYAGSFLLWTKIVAKNDLSYIVPFTSAIVNVISVCLGVLIFHEAINKYKLIGLGMAIIGVVLMNYK